MDKNKEFIINYQIKQNKSVLELLEKIGQLIISNISFFAGMLKSEKNFTDEMPKILTYTQGEIIDMKYQNKTIHQNINCKTWYTRYRENGKQYYVSGKTQQEVLSKLKTKLKLSTVLSVFCLYKSNTLLLVKSNSKKYLPFQAKT